MKIGKIAIFLLFFLFFAYPAFAQYDGMSIPTGNITPTPTQAPTVIHYELPYPGILPGNPVYSLKIVRDKFVELLTTNPTKRTEFYLLQADKRLSAALLLFDDNKPELAEHTLSKSQNYLEMSIKEAKQAKSLQNIDALNAKIKTSSQKQVEEINGVLIKEKGETAEKLKEDLKRAQTLEKNADELD